MHRYWFQFEHSDTPSPLNLGCGITAHSEADALKILHDKVFSAYGPRKIATTIVDVDISTLDENHVRPNMGLVVQRGVWFPLQ